MKKFVILFLVFIFPQFAFAATFSVDPKVGTYGPGDTFVATIRLDTDTRDECVNAVDVRVSYPTNLVKVSALSKGESILNLWTEEPSIDQQNGIVHFSGGIPGGYCGRVLGDPGKTNVVGKIIFSVPAFQVGGQTPTTTQQAIVNILPESTALINDGAGTPAKLQFENASFTRIPQSQNLHNEWTDAIHGDSTKPDDFVVDIVKDNNAFDGKYFLIFNTVDKQSGISHFEIMEEDPQNPGKIRGKRDPALFIRGTSPYVLTDQSLKSKITVRAIDNAGNRREVVVLPRNGGNQSAAASVEGIIAYWPWILLAMLVLTVGALSIGILRRRNRINKDAEYA